MPLESGGLPRVGGGGRPVAKTSDEVDQEDKLRAGEEDSRVGNVAIEREGMGEQRSRWTQSAFDSSNAGELGVLSGLSGEPGEMHR